MYEDAFFNQMMAISKKCQSKGKLERMPLQLDHNRIQNTLSKLQDNKFQ